MIIASDIVSGAYALLGRPSQADLPYGDVLDRASECIDGLLLDCKLSARSHTQTVGAWTTPDDREMSALSFTGGESNIIPVRMEWRMIGDANYIPRPVEIIAFEQIDTLYPKINADETYVAFYNGFTSIAFSETTETLSQREYRLSYESMANSTFSGITDTAELPALFTTLLRYETAMMCLDQVENESDKWANKRERLKQSLLPVLIEWRGRFQKWQTTRFGNKKVTKIGARFR